MTTTNPDLKLSSETVEQAPEIQLADSHVLTQATLPGFQQMPEILEVSGDTMSLPAALCDDKLLEEINAIPEKMGFKIGEVADILGVKQYVLRYWESEFDFLRPKKASNNQRYYTRKDVENVMVIRKLLHRDRFSIEGARSAMKGLRNVVRKEVRKDKEIQNMNHKFESVSEKMDRLLIDLRRFRQVFQ